MGLACQQKQLKTLRKQPKQLKPADSHRKSPWVYIWEGLLSEANLRLRFGGLILWRANFFLWGGGGGGLSPGFYGI